MARHVEGEGAEKARILRAFAFQVHRKQPLDAVVLDFIEQELQRGRRKEFRPAAEAFNAEGVTAAMVALGLLGGEGAALFRVLSDELRDHRLLSNVLESLAAYHEAEAA